MAKISTVIIPDGVYVTAKEVKVKDIFGDTKFNEVISKEIYGETVYDRWVDNLEDRLEASSESDERILVIAEEEDEELTRSRMRLLSISHEAVLMLNDNQEIEIIKEA